MKVEMNKVEMLKMKKDLEAVRGSNTNRLMSIIIPPNDKISSVKIMLQQEFECASNISGVSFTAIASAQQMLESYERVPPNGLVLYTGTGVTDDGKEEKVSLDFEPFKPINASIFMCDTKFHTQPLNQLLGSE